MARKQAIAIALDILIVACTILCLCLAFRMLVPGNQRRVSLAVLSAPAVLLLIYEAVCWTRPKITTKKRNPSISTLVLLGEDDRPIRIWDLTGKVGILIGKSSDEYAVDIDLADTAYETFIDPEHAILNYNHSGWWLQDTSSRNGVSIIRKGQELLLGTHAPTRIEPGDILCIAKYTRIAVN